MWGTVVKVTVKAVNIYGESAYSLAGGSAIILTTPDAPVNFTENIVVKTATSIGL